MYYHLLININDFMLYKLRQLLNYKVSFSFALLFCHLFSLILGSLFLIICVIPTPTYGSESLKHNIYSDSKPTVIGQSTQDVKQIRDFRAFLMRDLFILSALKKQFLTTEQILTFRYPFFKPDYGDISQSRNSCLFLKLVFLSVKHYPPPHFN